MTVETPTELPEDVRQNMLTLCKFVDKHTVEALKDPSPEKVFALVEINRNIASGMLESLNDENGEQAVAEEADAPHKDVLSNLNTQV